MEINLPPSGLAKVNYPDVFPTPPNRSPEPSDYSTTPEAIHQPSVSTRHLGEDSEDVWSYYVSEIAVRRIGNRLMNSFYKEDESSWLSMPLDRMIRVADELELQLTQWYVNIILPRIAKITITNLLHKKKGSNIFPQRLLPKESLGRPLTTRSSKSCNLCSMRDCSTSGSASTVHSYISLSIMTRQI